MGRKFRLALTQERMHMERVSPSLESNHKMAKLRHVLIGYLPSHGHLEKMKEPKSPKGPKTTVSWHIKCSNYFLRRMTNWERGGE